MFSLKIWALREYRERELLLQWYKPDLGARPSQSHQTYKIEDFRILKDDNKYQILWENMKFIPEPWISQGSGKKIKYFTFTWFSGYIQL